MTAPDKEPPSRQLITRRGLVSGAAAVLGGGVVEATLHPFQRVSRRIFGSLAYPDGRPPDVEMDWQDAQSVFGEVNWQLFTASPDARSRIQSTWHRAGLVAVEAVTYDRMRSELYQQTGHLPSQAVAFKTGEATRVGVHNLQHGTQDFLGGTLSPDGRVMRAAAMLIGDGDLRAGLGYYFESSGMFVPHLQTENLGPCAVNQLDHQFPGVPRV